MGFSKKMGRFLFVFLPVGFLGCGEIQKADKTAFTASVVAEGKKEKVVAQDSEPYFPKILDERALDTNIDPCEDFYEFSCKQWIDSTVIPPERAAVYRQFTPLNDLTDINLNKIIMSYVNNDSSNPTVNAGKIANYYTSCMNTTQNSQAALTVLRSQIKKIQAIKTSKDLTNIAAVLALDGISPFFSFSSRQSLQDSEKVVFSLEQGGYALGEKDYYFDDDEKSLEIVKKYKEYIVGIFELLGYPKYDSTKMANRVYNFEKKLAASAYSMADQSNPSKTNHPIGLAGIQNLTPNFAWTTYFSALENPGLDLLNVGEPEFFQNLNVLLKKTDRQTIIAYLTWLTADNAASFIGGAFEANHFAFWSKYLGGSKAMMPQWKKCTQDVENSLGYALAEAYVKTFDGATIKSKTEEMICEIKDAFSQDLKQLDWLDSETLGLAQEKVSLMGQKVGAPEVWRDYTKLELGDANYLLNALNIAKFEKLRDLAKIGKPVDKSEWGMMPWEVNAYYEPSLNEFNFPFGILQPPSLDLSASVGANMGAFGGGTIGHELIHGFDSDGSQFDARGNLRSWWSESTLNQFNEKAQCFIDQGNAYRVESVGLNVDAVQTLGENLADQGGVKLGYLALEKSLENRAEAPLWLNRYSERQQYWIAYAQSWCSKETPEHLRKQMTTDPHPPSEFRVNNTLMDRPEFARDFNCSANAKMAPAKRCSLW